MKHFSNLSIAVKIVLLVGLLGVISVAVTLYSMANMRGVNNDYSALISHEAKGALLISDASLDLSDSSRLVYAVLTEQEEEKIRANQAVLSRLHREFTEKINEVKVLIPRKNVQINEITAHAAKVFDTAALIIDAASRWRGDRALLIIHDEFEPALAVLQQKMDVMRDDSILDFETTSTRLDKTTNSTIVTTALSVSIGLLLVLALSVYVTITQISRPIKYLSRVMGRLTDRVYDDEIFGTTRRDEVGTMANALQVFKDTMQQADRLALEAAASAEARRLSEQLVDLTDAIPGAVFQMHVRADGWRRFLFISNKAADLHGRPVAELRQIEGPIGTDLMQAVDSRDYEKTKLIMASVQTLEPLDFDIQVEHGGRRLWLKTLATVRRTPDGGAMFNGVWLDVTEMKNQAVALEQAKLAAEQAALAKSSFLAMMSHEIRTPMNAVIGMVHLAQRTDLTQKQRNYLTKVDHSAHALLNIINDILDFSKIEAGQLALEEMTFSLEELLDSLSDVVGLKAEQKNIEIVFSISQDTPRYLVGDSLRLGQVLVNLVSNAVKFTEQGEIVVSVMPEQLSAESATLRFTIRDTGIGMTQKQMDGLFRSFSQADTSITRKYGGTGLGLAISKQLAEMMGGRIWVESEPDIGSTFSFTAVLGMSKAISPARIGARLAELRGKRVLVVDDNDNARVVLRAMLDANGFTAEAVSSGSEALSRLEQASRENLPFDLVLMDWRMPEMDGIETSRRIKSDQSLSRLPAILMVTAFGREEVMALASDAGLDGFLIKPVNESILVDTIAEMFVQHDDTAPRSTQQRGLQLNIPSNLAGRRILLVEDNPFNRDLAIELLTDLGMVVDIAENGRIGVERIYAETFDLILMDIQMPEMDGLTATRMIRTEERFDDLPILAMTAHAMSGDREKSLDAGMNDHITKPIDPEKLTQTLTHWLAKKPRVQRPQEDVLPTSVEMLPGEDIPDELPPFDIRLALIRTNGKRTLLRRLILSFRERYEHAALELRGLIAQARHDDAERLVHTIKGVAATLGAEELRDVADAMERAYHDQEADNAAELIERFETALSIAIAAAASLVQAEPAAAISETVSKNSAEIDMEEIALQIVQLKKDIASNNLKARKLFLPLRASLQSYGVDAELDVLGQALDGLQFSVALDAIDELARKLDLKG